MTGEGCSEGKGYRVMRGVIDSLEILLAIILTLSILIASAKLFMLLYKDLLEQPILEKTSVLEILDITLLLLLAIDILRTLLTGVVRRRFPIRIVVEAAMLAALREIISVEIRHLDWLMLLSLGIVFLILSAVWLRLGRIEAADK